MNTMNTYTFGSIQHTIKYIYDYYESPCLCPAALKLSQQDNQILFRTYRSKCIKPTLINFTYPSGISYILLLFCVMSYLHIDEGLFSSFPFAYLLGELFCHTRIYIRINHYGVENMYMILLRAARLY